MVVAVALAAMVWGCREEKKVDISSQLHPDRMPTMYTRNVSTLISDSGVTQYKIVAPVWYVYDEADTPYWNFPEGLFLQKYDPKFNVIATVAADSARYFKMQRLWRLEGNVEMKKVPKDLFLSQRVFWDQKRQQIYSDTFVHIENATHVLEGTGFVSNERLTVYRVLRPQGIFPVDRDNIKGTSGENDTPGNSSHVPSVAAQPRRPMAPALRISPADTVKAVG